MVHPEQQSILDVIGKHLLNPGGELLGTFFLEECLRLGHHSADGTEDDAPGHD